MRSSEFFEKKMRQNRHLYNYFLRFFQFYDFTFRHFRNDCPGFCDSSDSTILPSDTLEMIVRFFRFYDFAFRDFRNDVEICASSFESRSDVYNFMHRELDMEVLSKLENFSRLKGNNEANVWKLNADRVEECYFLYKTVNLFRNNGFLYLLNVKQADVEGKRRIKFRGNLSRVMEIDL